MERAGFWIRFVAMFIDGIIIGIIQFALSAIIGGGFDPETANTGLDILISFLLIFVYYVWFQSKNHGQTFGKKITGIRVTTIDGEPVTIGKMFLREIIGKAISTFILFIGYLMAAGKAKRALHDYLAKTIVIRVE
ncbi:RDD family protein [Anaerobacillus isosaccharinicus]|uniref:RDD family protein n=1 Tax=Anaerobacillus isosaccharinicus TaxID=1532552 RepID=A0A1S2KXB7_9BACI|nr:RDD family protein [Anaerobacillus isosaccharinicus]MBA5586874.1 RDD family protein [Anaerobacillus isosaccharinicus]QOY34915.1 RDD family protein [Anaerobacillus isosaccharinicus]